jgi:hypothetical protein
MTRKPHDNFAKQYLKGLLAPLGAAETSRDIFEEMQQVDVWFAPNAATEATRQALGLLGEIVANPCLLEPFRNPAPVPEIRACLSKLFALQAEERRRAKREGQKLSEAQLPKLWLLVPSASQAVLQGFGAEPRQTWTAGVYFLPEHLHTALVVIHQLSVTPETLWLRLLGRDRVQAQAMTELLNLPLDHPLRNGVLEYLTKLQVNLQSRQNLNREQRELAMNLDIVYEQWRQQTRQEARQEALHEEITDLLQARFGELDSALSTVVEAVLQLPKRDRTRLLLQLHSLSREELLAQFESNDR